MPIHRPIAAKEALLEKPPANTWPPPPCNELDGDYGISLITLKILVQITHTMLGRCPERDQDLI